MLEPASFRDHAQLTKILITRSLLLKAMMTLLKHSKKFSRLKATVCIGLFQDNNIAMFVVTLPIKLMDALIEELLMPRKPNLIIFMKDTNQHNTEHVLLQHVIKLSTIKMTVDGTLKETDKTNSVFTETNRKVAHTLIRFAKENLKMSQCTKNLNRPVMRLTINELM